MENVVYFTERFKVRPVEPDDLDARFHRFLVKRGIIGDDVIASDGPSDSPPAPRINLDISRGRFGA